jgi:hypothetical protein
VEIQIILLDQTTTTFAIWLTFYLHPKHIKQRDCLFTTPIEQIKSQQKGEKAKQRCKYYFKKMNKK